MCLQCVAEAQEVLRFVLPADPNAAEKDINRLGWHLYISFKENPDWPKGWYGLVRIDDPDFIFPLNMDDPDWDKIDFCCRPDVGYDFYNACVRAGYTKFQSGYFQYIDTWFIKYLIQKLKGISK